MHAYRTALVSGLFLAFAGVLPAQGLYPKPAKVLGDPNFIGTAATPNAFDSVGPNVVEGREVSSPLGVAVDNSVSPPNIYIADTANNRVLGFRYGTQMNPGVLADVIIGQPDRFTTTPKGPGTALSTGLRAPTGLAVDAKGNLYVADTGNNRILRYPSPLSQPAGYEFPDFIIGQTSFSGATANAGGISATSLFLSGSFFSHNALAFDPSGNLWVTDTGNNRVLRYPASSLQGNQNGPAADVSLGQTDMASNASGNTRTSKSGLLNPCGVALDGSGRLLVADALARVLLYPTGTTVNVAALRILGVDPPTQAQPNPATVSAVNISSVAGVAASGTNVFVVDGRANRVLVYPPADSWPAESAQLSPTAARVLGQSGFSDFKANQGGDPTASTLNGPLDVAVSGSELFVVDTGNNRVLAYATSAGATGPAATRVIGQTGFAYHAPNLAEGKGFYLSGSLSGGVSGAAVLDSNANPPHLYVADTLNNRVLGFADFRNYAPGQAADLVIGQPDFSRTTINYPSNNNATPNAQGLNSPSALAVDSVGNVYVADTFNARVLRFPAPFSSGKTALESADLVLGQSDFSTIVADATERTLAAPVGLAFTQAGADAGQPNSGYLAVVDANQNRALLFPKPLSNGMSATRVVGQPFFSTVTAGNSSTQLSSPRAVAVDPADRILIADTGNARVQGFDTVKNMPSIAPQAAFSITTGLANPFAIAMGASGQFWVAEPTQNAMLHFPGIDQLPLSNYASDSSLTVLSPRSAFVDSFNNLLLADGVNRVLYYVPGMAAVNAANFISGRPLAPGAFAALFPSAKTNTIASGTATADNFPLPSTLSDTQVVIAGNAAPLLFVSPGQINLPLPLSLPSGGTVDLQIVRPSTGQIYATAEIPLSSASPGLFTSNGSGTGPVAAINAADGTVNSNKAPVARGQYITLFGTGQGSVANAPPDGQASSGPAPTAAHPQILLGGAFVPDANIQYSGLAPSLAGVWQINFQVPATAPTGAVALKVLMNSIPSDNPAQPSQIAATLAIK